MRSCEWYRAEGRAGFRMTCSFSCVFYSTKVSVPLFHFARGVYRRALSLMRSLTVMCRLGLCGR